MSTLMKRMILSAFVVFSLASAAPAFALDLAQARSAGLVGEKTDGYIATVQATPEAQALVIDVNARRKTEYERISKENGQAVDLVAKLAAEQIISQLPAGSYYLAPDGSWKKR